MKFATLLKFGWNPPSGYRGDVVWSFFFLLFFFSILSSGGHFEQLSGTIWAILLEDLQRNNPIKFSWNPSTVLSTSLGKTFVAWRFILNENILFWLTISYQKPFVFPVSVFCSQIFTLKLNLQPKVGMSYAISKMIFGNFCLRKYVLLFFAEFK